ncbi:MAG: serine/threonine-protein kinase, partial [Shimia sp.]
TAEGATGEERTIIARIVPSHSEGDGDKTVLSPRTAPGTDASDMTPLPEGVMGGYVPPVADGVGPGQRVSTSGAPAAPPSTDAPTAAATIEPGMVIGGHYRVDEQLDQGGMGRVYKGWDLHTDATVAIKVILPERAEDQMVADLFRREAKTLRSLHHDAICRFFAYIPPTDAFNLHALVMGFIEGRKLSDRLKSSGGLPQQDAIRLALRLADGLGRAHEAGVVHRDLSPDNVMLPGDDLRKAVLIDFGISRSETIKDVTLGNEFAGKLKYVSPEQLGAFGGDAQGPSDVYSLGLLMIAMLTGRPSPMGDTIVEAVQMRQSVPDLTGTPFSLRAVLGRMLQPDPSLRLRTMAEVTEELSELVDGGTGTGIRSSFPIRDKAVEGLQAVPLAARGGVGQPVPASRPPERPERRRTRRGLGALVLLLALVGGGAFVAASQGYFGSPTATVAGPPDVTGLERIAGTRATFLAETVTEDCAVALRRRSGPLAGMIEAFAARPAHLSGVEQRYAAAFGASPSMVVRDIPDAQCAAIATVHALQGTRGGEIGLWLTADGPSRSDGIVGQIDGLDGRQSWLALIDPDGNAFSLMRQLGDPIGDTRRFAFRLPRAQPGSYLLVAVASDVPLVRTGAMQDGVAISAFLPLLLRELAEDGKGAADIAFLDLTP